MLKKVFVLENGSDMVVTILYRLLKEFIEDHGKLPRRLHLNLGISFSYTHIFFL